MLKRARCRRASIPIRAVLAARVARVALATLALACDGPVGPLPGGRLSGDAEPCPVSFAEYADEREVELEVAPERPRSVRIWSVVVGDRLFVPGDFLTPWKRWPHQVVADPRVRLRIAGRLFACRAERVGESGTIEALRRATAAKYALEPDGLAARSEVWWFALVPAREPAAQP